MSKTLTSDWLFKAKIVHLILSRDTEKALEQLSQHYQIAKPKLRVGIPKRHSKRLACYLTGKRLILVSRMEILYNPAVILHEFYHHLRNLTSTQKGLEKHADRFAKEYLEAYTMFTLYYGSTKSIRDE